MLFLKAGVRSFFEDRKCRNETRIVKKIINNTAVQKEDCFKMEKTRSIFICMQNLQEEN